MPSFQVEKFLGEVGGSTPDRNDRCACWKFENVTPKGDQSECGLSFFDPKGIPVTDKQ